MLKNVLPEFQKVRQLLPETKNGTELCGEKVEKTEEETLLLKFVQAFA